MKKILVAATSDPEGRAAVRRAVQEARLQPAEVLLLDYVRVSASIDPLLRRQESEAHLAEQRALLEGVGCSVRTEQRMGTDTIAAELLDLAADEGVDLIVIGIRRRSRVGKAMLGSAAQDVLLGARCPVLAVKAETDRDYPASGADDPAA